MEICIANKSDEKFSQHQYLSQAKFADWNKAITLANIALGTAKKLARNYFRNNSNTIRLIKATTESKPVSMQFPTYLC